MKTSIIVFPGTNREKDMAMAVQRVTGRAPQMVWHKETDIGNPDLIILPGGFSYGDYLRCGAMAAHSPIMKEVIRKAEQGTRIFGVCNGFQMLVETRLLPGALLRNNSLKFICKQVHLRCETTGSDFTGNLTEGGVMTVPIAHGEGNYFANDEILQTLESEDRVAFRYCDARGVVTQEANPNGSVDNIAGIYNKEKTILGMMP
ncbi:MAG: phosphoribosylformylglycinamidine synthase subunit PurQ, partial [Alphaproteobacteria bacterium]|nr:phosphoribosylformylglycinamidine synthase subunit PurQ [Alphaproteobacteria bacterium]